MYQDGNYLYPSQCTQTICRTLTWQDPVYFWEAGPDCGKQTNKQGRGLHPKPKFFFTAGAYFSAAFGPKFSDFLDLCLHYMSVVGIRILGLGSGTDRGAEWEK